MKVFISWSGEQSRLFGEAIRDWLPAVLQKITGKEGRFPYILTHIENAEPNANRCAIII